VRLSKLKNEPEVAVPTRAMVFASIESWRHVIGPLVPSNTDRASIATHKLQYIYNDST